MLSWQLKLPSLSDCLFGRSRVFHAARAAVVVRYYTNSTGLHKGGKRHSPTCFCRSRSGQDSAQLWVQSTVKLLLHPSKLIALMFHRDRASQYASKDFLVVLQEYKISSSMSRRGACRDDSCSPTMFGSLKVKQLCRQKLKTRRKARHETITWLLWYNLDRLHSTLAYISPAQLEQNWLANQFKYTKS